MCAKTLGIAWFYLRAVCQNHNLCGVEDFQEITIRHSKYAASRFAHVRSRPAFFQGSANVTAKAKRAAISEVFARSAFATGLCRIIL